MTRTAFRTFTLLMLLLMICITALISWKVRQADEQLKQNQALLEEKMNDFNNLSRIKEAQEKIDALTLDEKTTTQLDLLTYLGLENNVINFRVDSRIEKPAGDTTLLMRTVMLQVDAPYAEALAMADRLYASGKLKVVGLDLLQGTMAAAQPAQSSTDGDTAPLTNPQQVQLSVRGNIYSLDKKAPQP